MDLFDVGSLAQSLNIDLFSKIKSNNRTLPYDKETEKEAQKIYEIEKNLNNKNEDEIKIKIKKEEFDIEKIKEYTGNDYKEFEFRPQKWEEFIGQKNAKDRARTIIKQAERGIKSHLILSAIRGHGKSSYIQLLAKSLNAHLIEYVGRMINEINLINIINEINTSQERYVILFIDELDTIDPKVIKILNPIIESFKIGNKKIKPFIFAGATINKHILLQNNPDTLDRIPHHIKFKRYSTEEISQIIIQYKNKLYPEIILPEKVTKTISENCKFNPRTAIALLDCYIIENNIEKVLKNSDIIINGLTYTDIKILKVLNESPKALGANALALRCGISQKEYITEFEPFLYEFNYINRIPSRIITEKGIETLKKING